MLHESYCCLMNAILFIIIIYCLCCCFFRGYVYARNMELPIGWLACSGDILLHRPQMEFDNEDGFAKLANIIDKCSLQVDFYITRVMLTYMEP